MSNRIKPQVEVIADLKQAEGALAELAQIERKLIGIEADMNNTIDFTKAKAKQASASFENRKKELSDAIASFSTLNKSNLFKDKKSVELAFGIIGFRQSTQIAQANKISSFMTLEKLKEYGFNEAIRTKEEINKDAMQNWTNERLEFVGLKRRHLDSFYIELKQEELI